MPFHVEIRRSFHRARAFNLTEQELQPVADAWRRGTEVELGERRWDPRESKLIVLEGPPLSPQELSFGQGWQAAEKAGTDVTGRILRPTPGEVAVLAKTERAFDVAAARLAASGLRAASWRADAPAALVVVGDEPLSVEYALTVGLALGALGPHATLLDLGEAPLPSALRAYGPVGVDADLGARLMR